MNSFELLTWGFWGLLVAYNNVPVRCKTDGNVTMCCPDDGHLTERGHAVLQKKQQPSLCQSLQHNGLVIERACVYPISYCFDFLLGKGGASTRH